MKGLKTMKQIINGKLYNTETATFLGDYGTYCFNDSYYYEKLYATSKGTYFVHGKGGALSHYGIYVGNGLTGSERLKVLSESEAKEWAEQYLSPDKYTKIFGEIEEG